MERTKEFLINLKRDKQIKRLYRWCVKSPRYREELIEAAINPQAYEQFTNSARGLNIYMNMTFAKSEGLVTSDADLDAAIDMLSEGVFTMPKEDDYEITVR